MLALEFSERAKGQAHGKLRQLSRRRVTHLLLEELGSVMSH